MQDYPDGRRYEGFYKLDKRHGYGIYMQTDNTTYSGAWMNGKQHGYGCVYNSKGDLKYGLWNKSAKLIKVNAMVATQI